VQNLETNEGLEDVESDNSREECADDWFYKMDGEEMN